MLVIFKILTGSIFDGILYNMFHKNIYKQSLLSGGSFFQACIILSKFSNSFLAQFEKDIIVINVIDNFVVSRNCVFFRTWRVLHSQNSKMNFICKYEIVFLSMIFDYTKIEIFHNEDDTWSTIVFTEQQKFLAYILKTFFCNNI